MQLDKQTSKLSIDSIFVEAVKLPLIHALSCIKLSIPLIGIISLLTLGFWMMEPELIEQTLIESVSEPLVIGAFILTLCAIVTCTIMMIVGWHQVFILPEKAEKSPKMFRWGVEESRFLVWSVVIIFVFLLALLPPMFFLLPLLLEGAEMMADNTTAFALFGLIGIVIVALVVAFPRVLLALPAASVGKSIGIKGSWLLTKHFTLRLLVLLILIPWLASEGVELIATMGLVFTFFDYLAFVLSMYVYAVEVAILSLCYKALTSETESDKPTV
ncbi:MAG: hypothetical protein NZ775_01330 [Gammaproteobacteria bacterium]|nr:hypothetical protein [Gammaproteobacteria bacterium]